MRLATKIVRAAEIVMRNIMFESTCLASWCKLVNGEKVSYQGIFYYLQSGKPNSFTPPRIFYNGPVVWGVAVC